MTGVVWMVVDGRAKAKGCVHRGKRGATGRRPTDFVAGWRRWTAGPRRPRLCCAGAAAGAAGRAPHPPSWRRNRWTGLMGRLLDGAYLLASSTSLTRGLGQAPQRAGSTSDTVRARPARHSAGQPASQPVNRSMGSARLAQWNCRARQGTTTARWANVAGWAGRQAQSTHSDEFHTEARLAPPVLPDSFAHDPSLFARSLVIDCPSLPPPPRPGTHDI